MRAGVRRVPVSSAHAQGSSRRVTRPHEIPQGRSDRTDTTTEDAECIENPGIRLRVLCELCGSLKPLNQSTSCSSCLRGYFCYRHFNHKDTKDQRLVTGH